MSIEESRLRRREKQAAAQQPTEPQAVAQQSQDSQQPVEVQAPPLDLAAIRAVVHEVVAAELEAAQADQAEPLKAGLQRIYTELAELRAQNKILAAAVIAMAEEVPQRESDQAAPRREQGKDPKPYVLGREGKS